MCCASNSIYYQTLSREANFWSLTNEGSIDGDTRTGDAGKPGMVQKERNKISKKNYHAGKQSKRKLDLPPC